MRLGSYRILVLPPYAIKIKIAYEICLIYSLLIQIIGRLEGILGWIFVFLIISSTLSFDKYVNYNMNSLVQSFMNDNRIWILNVVRKYSSNIYWYIYWKLTNLLWKFLNKEVISINSSDASVYNHHTSSQSGHMMQLSMTIVGFRVS